MKKILVAAATVLFTTTSFATERPVTEKVLKVFQQSFTNAENPTWHDYTHYFEVTFRHNAIDTRISYSAEGDILKTVRYYSGAHLPIFLQDKLQKNYSDKKVFGVTEIAVEGETVYHVVLEDKISWLHVACNVYGDMSVTKKYKKA